MNEEWQPILYEDFEISFPGFKLLRLALNQHMPRVEKLRTHDHDHGQFLVYLRGYGVQHLGERSLEVRRGTVLSIPPRQVHRFVKERQLRPVCLVIDFQTPDQDDWPSDAILGSEELTRLEGWLVELHPISKSAPRSLEGASLVLAITSFLKKALERNQRFGEGPVSLRVRRCVESRGFEQLRPGEIARELGRSLDHLNRILRAESGKTVGDVIAHVRLAEAQRLLRNGKDPIGDVGSLVGIDDQNYFARWFRQQTGQSPSRWRSAAGG
ncbi:MAG: AraC family transcriptional regulator [Verrucomicrobiota bacterium]